jgi:hypothetical protein
MNFMRVQFRINALGGTGHGQLSAKASSFFLQEDVCVYYYMTYYNQLESFVKMGKHLLFITAGPIIKLCAGGGGQFRTCAMRYGEQRHVWTSGLITH